MGDGTLEIYSWSSETTQKDLKIPGTKRVDHNRAVKMYERAAGDKTIPSDLRPPKVLKVNGFIFREVHLYSTQLHPAHSQLSLSWPFAKGWIHANLQLHPRPITIRSQRLYDATFNWTGGYRMPRPLCPLPHSRVAFSTWYRGILYPSRGTTTNE